MAGTGLTRMAARTTPRISDAIAESTNSPSVPPNRVRNSPRLSNRTFTVPPPSARECLSVLRHGQALTSGKRQRLVALDGWGRGSGGAGATQRLVVEALPGAVVLGGLQQVVDLVAQCGVVAVHADAVGLLGERLPHDAQLVGRLR